MADSQSVVLLSWIARMNDPYRRNSQDDTFIVDENGNKSIGPTLSFLFDQASPYRGRVKDVELLIQLGSKEKAEYEKKIAKQTIDAINEKDPTIRVHPKYWTGENPVDHLAIFEFLKTSIPKIRQMYPDRLLVVNISPGTPAMHTVWVLMAETGFIEKPFELVQGVPGKFRKAGQPALIPVEIGLDTLYKTYQRTTPKAGLMEDIEQVRWDPAEAKSSTLKSVFHQARRIAALRVPVMILGERGTGKTTLATWLRASSPFRKESLDKNWPVIPCGQFTAEMMRSELFGHKKGSFTGAVEDRKGIVSEVDGDTLFLDEIGDISTEVQRLLIRALEEGQYTPIGYTKPIKSNFRLLTATNRSWETLQERLDLDFLDRISMVTIRMPALREIPEDLDWIWQNVFTTARQRAAVPDIDLSAKHHARIVHHLQQHSLPGNLRDLFRVAYQLLALLADVQEEVNPDDAVDYALEQGLASRAEKMVAMGIPQQIAHSFLEGRSLQPIFEVQGKIETAVVDASIKSYLANEIRKIARQQKVDPESICDVSKRTLQNWIKLA